VHVPDSPPLLIRGAEAVLRGGLARVDLRCSGGRIVEVGPALEPGGCSLLEATGLTVGPGFVDVHVHGGGGHSFFSGDPAAVGGYAAWAPRNGVTSFLVSTLGRDAAGTEAILARLAPAIGARPGAEPLGFHLEGPALNPERRGAFPASMLRPPDPAEFERYQAAAAGQIRQVTLAPELTGAAGLIDTIGASSAVAAMGHTGATAAEARAAFEAGVTHVTHLFNAMRPLHQREGGPIAAALLGAGVTCELICDGAHVAPEVLRLAYALLGPDRSVIVTDNLDIAGTSATSGSFGGPVSATGAAAARPDGTLVGSVATFDQHFRNALEFLDVDLPAAFRLASTNPARVAGVAARKGTLEAGKDADLVALDAARTVVFAVCRGVVAFDRRSA
jgi:N-acetylglucosamine-6-phosphate deacetylase